ncbi:MAG: hypothetical protein KAS72_12365 [Phycisphaerales bacterium]|nr:hypothetical protein [Phycisphaerales bacterium]
MPITATYDVTNLDQNDRTRIRSAFERFGWEHIGGSTFRYPAFEHAGNFEDWLNCVVPALHFFRSFILSKGITLSAFTLDTHSSSCFKDGVAGTAPEDGATLPLTTPTNPQMGEQPLRDWVSATTTGIP